jgi:aldose 1-epimerase
MDGIERATFGQLGSQQVDLYTLRNRRGHMLKITSYGATLTELHLPDREERLSNVVLGFESLAEYVEHRAFFGATVGRVANRIRDGVFVLEGERHEVARTDGAHHLHGGRRGWDRAVWRAIAHTTPSGPCLELAYTSEDGEEGYPGRVEARVAYTLTDDDELFVEMRAETDRTTIINMAHHTYWNLGGPQVADILDHEVVLRAQAFTPGDPVVPVGQVQAVAGTPFDFTKPKPVGRDVEGVGDSPRGFDHNWVVDGPPGQLRPVAEVYHPASGRVMSLEADAPGVQFYSGNFLDGSLTGQGRRYGQRAGLCLETQAFPNAINVPAWAEQVILRPGFTYRHNMVHRFSVR